MKTSEFLAVLSILQSAISPNEPFDKILFKDPLIIAFNGMSGIRLEYETGINGAVLADPLLRTLRKFLGGEIELTQSKKSLNIKSNREEKLRLALMEDAEKFFAAMMIEVDDFEELPDNFENALVICEHTAGGLMLKESVQGVYFIGDVALSTNDAALTKVSLENKIPFNFFVHNSTVSILAKTIPVSVASTDKTVIFDCPDDIQVICPLFEYSRFPYSYKALLSEFGEEHKVPRGFTEAVKKSISTLHTSKSKQIRLSFNKGKLVLRTKNEITGAVLTDKITLDNEIEDKFYLDPEILTKFDFCNKYSISSNRLRLTNEEFGVEVVIAKILQ